MAMGDKNKDTTPRQARVRLNPASLPQLVKPSGALAVPVGVLQQPLAGGYAICAIKEDPHRLVERRGEGAIPH
eukprot:CAMPEP_0181253816 /NCGR_PEP_ID=MMETSP1096-20121128/48245_1 /TAXON_ID=156174 ORGANISM="Chrysochromulina ericina, Strain CCMP281" /NCGR_SAMPLE_ID=MMETSP1096 /ASSEMBLY_ACC=CAM_ASM_000453 /LENGTH=72 /DNA_ID=CAMNT_0023351757 /DNA_START=197 /DNA_END=415 /DNA_ORIENTATION=-